MTEPKTDTLSAPGAVLHYDVRSAETQGAMKALIARLKAKR